MPSGVSDVPKVVIRNPNAVGKTAAFAVFEICDLPTPKRSLVTNLSQAAMWKTCRQSEQWPIIGIAIF
jgi:hypothetical protein